MKIDLNQENAYFTCSYKENGIVSLSLDMKNQKTNLLIFEFMKLYFKVLHDLLSLEVVKGIIITSKRSDFIAGADIHEFLREQLDPQKFLSGILEMHRQFALLDHYKKPIISIIEGNCIGGGYEFALNTHYRIAVEGNYRIGLPETKLGLFPGAGGAIKTARMWGISKAIKFVVNGSLYPPKKAAEFGLVDALCETDIAAWILAEKWIVAGKPALHRWGDHNPIPGGNLRSVNGAQEFAIAVQWIKNKTKGKFPGINYYLKTLHDGLGLPVEKALEVEARYLVKTLQSDVAQNMINTLFFGVQEAKKNKYLDPKLGCNALEMLGVIGGGMMGTGIAANAALSGFKVLLSDQSEEATLNSLKVSKNKIQKILFNKGGSNEQIVKVQKLIQPLNDLNALEEVDLVIEAVPEDLKLKKDILDKITPHLNAQVILASNTSSIPINDIFKYVENKENVLGMHFFSPVDKMTLLEIVKGSETSTKTLSFACQFAHKMGKIPIVVQDSPGFFTSRVFGKYTQEAVLLYLEGIDPKRIENVALNSGWPIGPFAVLDEVSLKLVLDVLNNQKKVSISENKYKTFLTELMKQGRIGKKTGKGFYTYTPNGKSLWLKSIGTNDTSDEDIVKRLNYVVALDSYRCLVEGIVTDTRTADLASILGFGFPIHSGGVFRYIDAIGLKAFVSTCEGFLKHGAQWEVSSHLKSMSQNAFQFYDGSKEMWGRKTQNGLT
ncbi:MAG: enoyl-CoA hydratase/isomerase family protein [Flavobacterium sp.]|nr:enoyl-CoA hydratase/isomerase family protein [Candidatus Neoflavobacterium equi]